MKQLALIVALALTWFPGLATAQARDPRCEAQREPVPEAIDCGDKIDAWLRAKQDYEATLRRLQGIIKALGDNAWDGVETGLKDALDALNPLPSDLEGGLVCLAEQVCKKAVGLAIFVGRATYNQADSMAEFLKLVELRNTTIAELATRLNAVEAAYQAALQCRAEQDARNAEIDRIEAANAAAKPALPADDPLCNPPGEGGTTTSGGPTGESGDVKLKYGDLVGKPIEVQRKAREDVAGQVERCRELESSGADRQSVSTCFSNAYNNAFVLVDAVTQSRSSEHDPSHRDALEALRQDVLALRKSVQKDRDRTR